MTMTAEQRQGIVMSSEGNVLSNVERVGADYVAEYTRASIDGSVNALIRMQGAEAAARFVFALGDRVAAGLREPTDFHALVIPQSMPAPAGGITMSIEEANEIRALLRTAEQRLCVIRAETIEECARAADQVSGELGARIRKLSGETVS